jgi:hypothetical protein
VNPPSRRYKLRKRKPYVVVIHPETGKSAVFNRDYELMAEEASIKLIGTGVKRHTGITRGFTFTLPHQQPSWMEEEMKAECISFHLYNDMTYIEEIEALPGG